MYSSGLDESGYILKNVLTVSNPKGVLIFVYKLSTSKVKKKASVFTVRLLISYKIMCLLYNS